MGTLTQDLRYSLRMLAKSPGFTAAAVITLSLALGATTTIFSFFSGILFKPPPFEDPGQLVMVWEKNLKNALMDKWPVSGPGFYDWQDQSSVFVAMAGFTGSRPFNLTGKGEPERLRGRAISAGLLALLEAHPIVGRAFASEEERVGYNHLVLISERLWKQRLEARPDVSGQMLSLNGQAYTVIGVMPFSVYNDAWLGKVDIWVPLVRDDAEAMQRGTHSLNVIARLKPGVSLREAQSEMDTIAGRLEAAHPETNTSWGINIVHLREEEVAFFRPLLLAFLGAAGFVLLIACANVTNLFLARAATRQKEFAIRMALGASGFRLARMLLTESVLVALMGAIVGTGLAHWGVRSFVALAPAYIPRLEEISIDKNSLVFTIGVSLLTAILVGLVPAIQSSRSDPNEALKEGGRSSVGGGNRTRSLLVVVEVALSVVLLIGAGLLMRSFVSIQAVSLGFRPDNLLTMRISLTGSKYSEKSSLVSFYQRLLDHVASVPGVRSASLVSSLPLGGAGGTGNYFFVQGRPRPATGEEPNASSEVVTPDYFLQMDIRLLKGRYFTDQDVEGAPKVAIITSALAERFFPDEDPIGRGLTILPQMQSAPNQVEPSSVQIVGVVGDVKHYGLTLTPYNEFYVPFRQNPVPSMYVALRTAVSPRQVIASVRSGILNVDKDQPVYDLRTMEELLSESVTPQRFYLLLLGVFAGIALMMSVVGTYGVVAYSVTQRRHEIGIRIALGAQRVDLLKLVVGHATALALAGIAVGLALSVLCTNLISSLLYNVTPYDPLILGSVSLILVLAAMMASYIPARTTLKIDPMTALRQE
jgi:putative ABC transport system permease protein